LCRAALFLLQAGKETIVEKLNKNRQRRSASWLTVWPITGIFAPAIEYFFCNLFWEVKIHSDDRNLSRFQTILPELNFNLSRFARNFLARNSICRFNFRRMKQKAYAAAGVDIDLGNRVKASQI
jgi:hypothetical protein